MRLALVTPRFWPLVGDAETHLLAVAQQLQAAGHAVTVVTATWQPGWPRHVSVREIPVVRLRGAPRGGFGTLRYMYALSRWLEQQQGSLDAVLVSSLRYEAYVAVGALAESKLPVILQAEASGPAGDVAWQSRVSFGSRIARRCREATGFIAASSTIAAELAAAGYNAGRTTTIGYGVPLPRPHSALAREASRAALAGINYDLTAAAQQPVVLGLGRLIPEQGFAELATAWQSVAARFPHARLWIVGDGPQRERLYQLIGDLDLRQKVFLPGTFAQTEELYQAADLFVHPAVAGGPPLRLAEALAAGLPAVTTDLPENRDWIASGETGLLVPPGDHRALGAAIGQLLDDPPRAIAMGAEAREQIREAHSLDACVQRYLELFESLS